MEPRIAPSPAIRIGVNYSSPRGIRLRAAAIVVSKDGRVQEGDFASHLHRCSLLACASYTERYENAPTVEKPSGREEITVFLSDFNEEVSRVVVIAYVAGSGENTINSVRLISATVDPLDCDDATAIAPLVMDDEPGDTADCVKILCEIRRVSDTWQIVTIDEAVGSIEAINATYGGSLKL